LKSIRHFILEVGSIHIQGTFGDGQCGWLAGQVEVAVELLQYAFELVHIIGMEG